jgi:hypothetical protein
VDLTNIVDQAGAIIAITAALGILLLLPLYISQRRDLKRLVEWMEAEPEHPTEDAASSEQILDRAEAEIERLTGEFPAVGAEPSDAASRVTSERPALERITMERAALLPHPRWRRFRDTVTQPRWMTAIAAAAVLLALGAIFGSQVLLETGEERGRTARVNTADTTVAVLNGTTVAGLGQKVGDDVEANDFSLGDVTTFSEPVEQTVILFEKGSERQARRLAAKLGGTPVQPIDRQAQRLSGGADVVVIVGQDRATAGGEGGGPEQGG